MPIKERLHDVWEEDLFTTLTQVQRIENSILVSIATALREKRKEMGMTLEEFAHHLNERDYTVALWEAAEYDFTIHKLVSVFSKLDMDISVIFKDAFGEGRRDD